MIDETAADASTTESSTVNAPQGDGTTSPATTQPDGQQPRGFHEHPDWQRMVASRREDRAVIQQLRGELQRIGQHLSRQSSQPGTPALTTEEQQAVATIKRLMQADPDLAAALGLNKRLSQIDERLKGSEAGQQQAAKAHIHAARVEIKSLATEAGLPTDEKSLTHIARLVALEAQGMEGGDERFASGDMSILREAFDAIKSFLGTMRKPAETTLAKTKNKTGQLPPPARGAAPGPAAPPKLQPGKEREYEAGLHSLARKMLEQS